MSAAPGDARADARADVPARTPRLLRATGAPGPASAAVFAVFFLSGFAFSGWASRLPAVRDSLGLEPDEMGLLLLALAAGSVIALPLSGLVVERLGARRTVVAAGTLGLAGLTLAGVAVALHNVWLTAPCLFLWGVGTAVWDAAMNLEGAAVEQRLGRAVMPRYHAGFSFGTMAGAAIAAGAAALHVPVVIHLAVVLGLAYLALLVATRHFLPEGTHARHEDEPASAARSFGAWRERRTLLIGVVVLAAALAEGSANDWVSLAVVDGFETSDAVGAFGFAVFVTAMTGMRLLGTRLIDRFGRVGALRITATLAFGGLLVFGLVPSLPVALVGVLAWGAGAALGFPVGMSAAADDPRRAPGRVAVVSTLGYTAFLAGPPLLGLLADHVGYRSALLAITVPAAVGLLLAGVVRPLPTAEPAPVVPVDPGTGPAPAPDGVAD
jgi:MFS family permease